MARNSAVKVESRDLYRLTKDLQGVDRKLATAMKAEMRKVADPIRARVAAEASWSSRIPGAVKVRVKATKLVSSVQVYVDRKKAPHARPLEHGSSRNSRTVRHPLFGNRDRWVSQPTRPFFAKAVKASDYRIDQAIEQVAEKFERAAGFR